MKDNKSTGTGILAYFIRHGTAANLLLLVLMVLGVLSLPRMQKQFFPDVIINQISVLVNWDGAGPEDVDNAIVQILEPALLAVEGVLESSARAREGNAHIYLEFEPNWDMARAETDVQNAVNQISELPEGAETPIVRRGVWRDTVTDVVISGPVGVNQLGRFADELVAQLFTQGVTRVSIRGIAAPGTVIQLSEARLVNNDISLAEIAASIAAETQADPSGDVAGGAVRVRTGEARRSADAIGEIELRSNADGSKLRIADVAHIYIEPIDRAQAYFVGEAPAIIVAVERGQGGDAIEIQSAVENTTVAMLETLPEGVEMTLVRTRSEAITSRINILIKNAAMGLGLVLVLLLLFLNTRTALWVALGIPVAMLSAILFMYLAGLSLNMISVFALIICLGIVVDDAIVVGEHADFRYRNLNESPVSAAENAARRMWLPVLSATLTTTIAFFGLTAIGGRFGSLIDDIPFTVIVVLIASLVECFLILPNHMRHSLSTAHRQKWYDYPSRKFNIFFMWFREAVFRKFIRYVIMLRYPTVGFILLLFASQLVLVINETVQWRFFNSPEQGQISGNFAMVNGAERADSMEMLAEIQRAVEQTAKAFEDEYGISPVSYVVGQVGGGTGRGLAGAGTKDTDLLGGIFIELIDADLRPYSSFEFLRALQGNVVEHSLLETFNFRSGRRGPGGDSLDVQLIGLDSQRLKDAAEALKEEMRVYPEVSALEDSLAYDKEEIVLTLTAQGRALGFSTDTLGRVLRNRLEGITATTYPVGSRSAQIRVELAENDRTADFLERTQIRSIKGVYIPLADIVTMTRSTGFSTVERENGLRVISVTGDISEDNAERAAEITYALSTEIIPSIESRFGVDARLGGLSEQENRFLKDAMTGFILCLVGIFIVLAWVFSSWTRPFVVMAVIPFGLIGVIWGHYLWSVPLSMFSVVGLIGMVGIVINDSIVLVTTIDEYAEEKGIIQAIIDGTTERFRPVLLTTLTTVFGLAPLLYETSRDAQFLRPTVITLCYGLGFGMVLVLALVPALMAMQRDIVRLRKSALNALYVRRRYPRLWAIYLGTAIVLIGAFIASFGSVFVAGEALGRSVIVFCAAALVICSAGFIAALFLLKKAAYQPAAD